MSKVKFELNRDGVKELLQCTEMESIISEYARRITDAAGDGYGYETRLGKTRVSAKIKPETAHAYYSNRAHDTLNSLIARKWG